MAETNKIVTLWVEVDKLPRPTRVAARLEGGSSVMLLGGEAELRGGKQLEWLANCGPMREALDAASKALARATAREERREPTKMEMEVVNAIGLMRLYTAIAKAAESAEVVQAALCMAQVLAEVKSSRDYWLHQQFAHELEHTPPAGPQGVSEMTRLLVDAAAARIDMLPRSVRREWEMRVVLCGTMPATKALHWPVAEYCNAMGGLGNANLLRAVAQLVLAELARDAAAAGANFLAVDIDSLGPWLAKNRDAPMRELPEEVACRLVDPAKLEQPASEVPEQLKGNLRQAFLKDGHAAAGVIEALREQLAAAVGNSLLLWVPKASGAGEAFKSDGGRSEHQRTLRALAAQWLPDEYKATEAMLAIGVAVAAGAADMPEVERRRVLAATAAQARLGMVCHHCACAPLCDCQPRGNAAATWGYFLADWPRQSQQGKISAFAEIRAMAEKLLASGLVGRWCPVADFKLARRAEVLGK